jgi:hypothetical protein
MLKKQVCYSTVISAVALLFFSCFSTPSGKVVFDPDLPEEQSAVVIFDYPILVQQYNGIDVKNAWYPKGNNRKNTVILPAGYSTITLNYSIYIGSVIISRNNIELRYDFEAEREYSVGSWVVHERSESFSRGEKWFYGIGVWTQYSDVGKRDKAIKYWEIGESPAD